MLLWNKDKNRFDVLRRKNNTSRHDLNCGHSEKIFRCMAGIGFFIFILSLWLIFKAL